MAARVVSKAPTDIQLGGGRDAALFSEDDFGGVGGQLQGIPRGDLDGSLSHMTSALSAMTMNDSEYYDDGASEPGYRHGCLPSGYSRGGSSSGQQGYGSLNHGASSSGGPSRGYYGGEGYNDESFGGDGGYQDGDGDNDEDENPGQAYGTSPLESGMLGCPFRKHNHKKYNYRHYHKCTKPFKDFHALKKHIRAAHENDFESTILEKFRDRKGKSKVDSWQKLWEGLFPDWVGEIPAHDYEPCVLLERFEAEEAIQRFGEDQGLPACKAEEFIIGRRKSWQKKYGVGVKRLKNSEKPSSVTEPRESSSSKTSRKKGKSSTPTLTRSSAPHKLLPKQSPTTSDESVPGTADQQNFQGYPTMSTAMLPAPVPAAQYGQPQDPNQGVTYAACAWGVEYEYQQYDQHDAGGSGAYR
ncbi:hypothetical protein QBC34DRAFT_469082 [Podospora aff. communis PSN243]|uniref:C2H2-type domain-containing protein n=1 Tax=Podospora aff. communis PSN243 TaxID=3040156 RepID=A0AAV9GH10_9PEZI|nr:hypothetical protein QBC34DRAFT_469082 [Podospora aff. communis PSN243]